MLTLLYQKGRQKSIYSALLVGEKRSLEERVRGTAPAATAQRMQANRRAGSGNPDPALGTQSDLKRAVMNANRREFRLLFSRSVANTVHVVWRPWGPIARP